MIDQKNKRGTELKKLVKILLAGIVFALIVATIAALNDKYRLIEPPRPTATERSEAKTLKISTNYFQAKYTGKSLTDEQEQNGIVRSFDDVIFGIIGDPVGNMKRLDYYEPIIQKAATQNGISARTIRAIMYLESGGKLDLLSPAGCAGIGQFAASTARGYGLKVSPQWRTLYRSYRTASIPKIRQNRWNKLQKADERFNPRKSIFATAKYLADSADALGGMEEAVAAYHMGGGNVSRVRKLYRNGNKQPKQDWGDIVLDVDPKNHPKTYAYLHNRLKDDSCWYFFKVAAASEASKLWKTNRKSFKSKVFAYDWAAEHGRRPRLAKEFGWYKNLPNYSRDNVSPLVAARILRPIVAGKEFNLSIKEGVTYPYLTPEAAGAILYVASEVKKMGGKPLRLTDAFRTETQQQDYIRRGLAKTEFTSHRAGMGIDLSIPTGRTLEALQWSLTLLRARGDLIWYKEGNHYHVTISPKADHFANVADQIPLWRKTAKKQKTRLANLETKIAAWQDWSVDKQEDFWGILGKRLHTYPIWLIAICSAFLYAMAISHRPRKKRKQVANVPASGY